MNPRVVAAVVLKLVNLVRVEGAAEGLGHVDGTIPGHHRGCPTLSDSPYSQPPYKRILLTYIFLNTIEIVQNPTAQIDRELPIGHRGLAKSGLVPLAAWFCLVQIDSKCRFFRELVTASLKSDSQMKPPQ